MNSRKDKLGRFKKGNKPPPFSEQHRKRLSQSLAGRKLSKQHRENMSKSLSGENHPNFGKHHSKITKRRISNAKKGKRYGSRESYFNKILDKSIRWSLEYRQWRSDVFQRDNWTCQTCGKRGCYLEAHHIIRFIDIIKRYDIKTIKEAIDCKMLWDIDNGVTLCRECHQLTKHGRPKNRVNVSE